MFQTLCGFIQGEQGPDSGPVLSVCVKLVEGNPECLSQVQQFKGTKYNECKKNDLLFWFLTNVGGSDQNLGEIKVMCFNLLRSDPQQNRSENMQNCSVCFKGN